MTSFLLSFESVCEDLVAAYVSICSYPASGSLLSLISRSDILQMQFTRSPAQGGADTGNVSIIVWRRRRGSIISMKHDEDAGETDGSPVQQSKTIGKFHLNRNQR